MLLDYHQFAAHTILRQARSTALIYCSTIEEGNVHCTEVSDLPFWWTAAFNKPEETDHGETSRDEENDHHQNRTEENCAEDG